MQKILRMIAAGGALIMALLPIPVLAIDPPDAMTINDVWAYQHCLESGDQLYLIDYQIDYTALPTELAPQAYIFRLMDGSTELSAIAPYNYFDKGYGRGVAAIYFSTTDAPTWNDGYSIQLSGNPTLSWTSSVPTTSALIGNWSASASVEITSYELSAKILWLADQLENEWSIDMIEQAGTGSVLAEYGEAYFTNVIDQLREMAPYVFSGMALEPEWTNKTYSGDYENQLQSDKAGTPFDWSSTATALGMSENALTSGVWLTLMIFVLALITGAFGTYKPAVLFSTPMIIAGALLGMLPLTVAILTGFLALMATAYVLFLQKASA